MSDTQQQEFSRTVYDSIQDIFRPIPYKYIKDTRSPEDVYQVRSLSLSGPLTIGPCLICLNKKDRIEYLDLRSAHNYEYITEQEFRITISSEKKSLESAASQQVSA